MRSGARESGFALIEVMLSITLLVVGALGLLSSLLAARHIEQGTITHSARMRVANRAVRAAAQRLARHGDAGIHRAFFDHAEWPGRHHHVPEVDLTKDLPTTARHVAIPVAERGSESLGRSGQRGQSRTSAVRITITGGGRTTVLETIAANDEISRQSGMSSLELVITATIFATVWGHRQRASYAASDSMQQNARAVSTRRRGR